MAALTPTQGMIAEIGRSLPDRERVKGTTSSRINIEPQGTIKVTHTIDTFRDSKNGVDPIKNNLEGKKVVLFFGSESNMLTRTFMTPKLAMIYHFLTKERDDVEIVYVSLDKTQKEFDRFTKSHPWPCVPWKEKATLRSELEKIYYTPLKKAYGNCGIVIFDSDHETILNPDAEPGIARTHCETGEDFPWVASTAETCCASAAVIAFCTIM